MIALALKILLAYLLGSVSGSMVLGRFRQVDIRNDGIIMLLGIADHQHGRRFGLYPQS